MFQRGDQIAYIPLHAGGDIGHPDVKFGFVMGPAGTDSYFCRYWREGEPGVLRTVANSESTPAGMLVPHYSVPQVQVDGLVAAILAEYAKRSAR